MALEIGPRRGIYIEIAKETETSGPLTQDELSDFEEFDLIYRSLCAMLYNYVPASGHPGGSISSGRFVASLLFDAMDYDMSRPTRENADIISYAAGHKALGLYAMWALRNEVTRAGAADLLPDEGEQLRLEDLLGFRRNPVTKAPLFQRFRVKPLDGHPTPATPFVRLSTGASGVGLPTSLGLAIAAIDTYGERSPRVHIVEGEGGLTPGRVAEALAAAGTASLYNVVLHIDWNQASIDSNHVCRDAGTPGDYVQWNPLELAYLHDWNVIDVPDGTSFQQTVAAQRRALEIDNGQPTAIVYRTVKGWKYGIEGRESHGAGHKLCSDGFYTALTPLLDDRIAGLPTCCDLNAKRCSGSNGAETLEGCLWDALGIVRKEVESRQSMVAEFARRLVAAKSRLDHAERKPKGTAPRIEAVYDLVRRDPGTIPSALKLEPGSATTLRAELGRVLNLCNRASGGAFLVAAADLLGSTSVNKIGEGFEPGYYNAVNNPQARLLSIGGICEDAMSAFASGLSSFGNHIGVASSYGAFIAPLGHIAARLHAIGNQARQSVSGESYRPMILVCAHAGLKTGEDGPTHADPQPLQLLQGNFPAGTCITLTPWDPQELWPLMATALARRPAVIAPFVTRPNEVVPDRLKLGLAPATDSRFGVYALRSAHGTGDGTLVLQGSGVTLAFVEDVLPRLERDGIDLNVYYVASAELFDALPREQREGIFPEARGLEAMGITGFTLPTLYRWVVSEHGRVSSLYPFKKGRFLGSGQADMVLAEAGLDGEGQYLAIRNYVEQMVRS